MTLFTLIVAFLLTGVVTVTHKALIGNGLGDYRSSYLMGFYLFPIILGIIMMFIFKLKPTFTDMKVGFFMGLAQISVIITTLFALQALPGIVAFPLGSMGSIIFSGIVSVIIWKDKLSKSQWAAMGLALVAIYLIN